MKIDKAIEDLQARIDGEFAIKGIDNCEDMKLGIEALKRLQMQRSRLPNIFTDTLPGETKD